MENGDDEWQQNLIATIVRKLLDMKKWRDLIKNGRTLEIEIHPSSGILPEVDKIIVAATKYPQIQITTLSHV